MLNCNEKLIIFLRHLLQVLPIRLACLFGRLFLSIVIAILQNTPGFDVRKFIYHLLYHTECKDGCRQYDRKEPIYTSEYLHLHSQIFAIREVVRIRLRQTYERR